MAKKSSTQNGGTIAVIATGGKQYVVSEGKTITIEKLTGEHKTGGTVSFDRVLLVDDGSTTKVGTPAVSGAKVEGKLMEQGKGDKVTVIKYKAKSRYFKKRGHRQPFMKVSISSIK